MSLLRLNISQFFGKLRFNSALISNQQVRTIYVANKQFCEVANDKVELNIEDREKLEAKDRSKIIPVETSIEYLASEAYRTTYGNQLVWEQYRRNHKGLFAPRRTRKTCVRKGVVSTGSPCPICRDEYLILDHRNIDLLKQFISPYSGEVRKFYI